MAEKFETFVRTLSDLAEGRETVLALSDLTPGHRKYLVQYARVVVARTAGDDFKPLKVRSRVGNPFPGEWFVRVIEILPGHLLGVPYSNVFDIMQGTRGKHKM